MKDSNKTKAQLIEELTSLRQRTTTQLEAAEKMRAEVEKTLRQSEEKFRGIFEIALTGIGISNAAGKMLAMNPAMGQITGYTLEDFAKLNLSDTFVDPENGKKFHEILQRDGAVENFEVQLRRKNGHSYWASLSCKPITYAGIDAFMTTTQEITERMQAEGELRLSQIKYKALLENAPVGVWEAAKDGSGGYINPKLAEMSGLTMDTAEGTGWASALHPEDQERIFAEWQAFVEGNSPFNSTYRFQHDDGTVNWVIGQAVPIATEDDARLGFVGTLTDITDRVRDEKEREGLLDQIRAQAHHVEQIIATVPEGVILLDAEHRVLLANPFAEKNLLVLAKAKVGDTLTHLGDQALDDFLTSPPTKGLWHEVIADDRTFEVIARPMDNGPEAENWVLVIKDVTREREVQEQLHHQERLAVVGQLAAGIAHDFNNILGVIGLHTQIALSMPDTPAHLRDRLEISMNQAERAVNLIQQLLDFGRRAVLERQPLDLVPFMREMSTLLESAIPEHIKIDLSYGSDEYIVNADPGRIEEMIMNLIINARDIMPSGGELSIALSQIEETDKISCVSCGQVKAAEWVSIAVSDTGTGIPPDDLPHIFEPFFTTKAPGKGSGLGLAQVYGIVKQHQGHIDVTTELGAGTMFVIYLPPSKESSVEVADTDTEAFAQGQGQTLLVVEDEPTLREALVEALQLLNYRVLEASNGRAAIEVLERHSEVALVLSDLVMPEMGGQALFHAMQRRGLTQPIVMLSGHAMENELVNLQAKGLAGWLLKPPCLDRLAALIAQVLEEDSEKRNDL